MASNKPEPIHPGEILLEDFLKPLNLSQSKLADNIDVSRQLISAIVNKKRSITPNTAKLLSKYFKTSTEVWLNLQADYDHKIREIAA